MQLETCRYTDRQGWSTPLPDLDSDRTLVLVFGASEGPAHAAGLGELRAAFPRATLLGCSTAGEIFGTTVIDDSLVVGIVRFEHTTLRCTSASVGAMSASRAAGRALAHTLTDPALRAVFVLSDGLSVNGSALAGGLNEELPASVVVTGGLAGDGARFQRTWVLHEGRPTPGLVTAVGLYGPRLRVGYGSKGGWDLFGIERTVTRSEGNVLYELDGRPVLDLYKEYLGERAAGLPATALLFPLALRTGSKAHDRVVRTVLAVDEAANALVFAGDVPQDARAQLMRANLDRLIQGASEAALTPAAAMPGAGPVLSIAISCVGRRLVLGERAEEETEATLDVLPPGTKQIGFYSYGELSPLGVGGCDLHNQTMTLTTLGED